MYSVPFLLPLVLVKSYPIIPIVEISSSGPRLGLFAAEAVWPHTYTAFLPANFLHIKEKDLKVGLAAWKVKTGEKRTLAKSILKTPIFFLGGGRVLSKSKIRPVICRDNRPPSIRALLCRHGIMKAALLPRLEMCPQFCCCCCCSVCCLVWRRRDKTAILLVQSFKEKIPRGKFWQGA